ncbi:ArsR/SmtB family transcription factor [Sulfodiicoccus acidiphilus]|nr:metalloregulator ArsR/SmtB family transcription factor [Sulfodiicoccus acidiphilus]
MVSLFSALADTTRLGIVLFLYKNGSATVQDISKSLSKSQSLISHHLACLKNCGVVSYRREGRFIYYSLNGVGIREIVNIALKHVADYGRSILACEVIKGEEPT